jgi:hypothetical protein
MGGKSIRTERSHKEVIAAWNSATRRYKNLSGFIPKDTCYRLVAEKTGYSKGYIRKIIRANTKG